MSLTVGLELRTEEMIAQISLHQVLPILHLTLKPTPSQQKGTSNQAPYMHNACQHTIRHVSHHALRMHSTLPHTTYSTMLHTARMHINRLTLLRVSNIRNHMDNLLEIR